MRGDAIAGTLTVEGLAFERVPCPSCNSSGSRFERATCEAFSSNGAYAPRSVRQPPANGSIVVDRALFAQGSGRAGRFGRHEPFRSQIWEYDRILRDISAPRLRRGRPPGRRLRRRVFHERATAAGFEAHGLDPRTWVAESCVSAASPTSGSASFRRRLPRRMGGTQSTRRKCWNTCRNHTRAGRDGSILRGQCGVWH